MADTKISAATSTTPQTTDLIPLARSGSSVARQATVAAIVQAQTASSTAVGSVELATDAEAITGTDTTRAVTPANLMAAVTTHMAIATTSIQGKVELATDAEAIAGADTERAVTPANLAAVGATHVPAATTSVQGKVELATNTEVSTGTDSDRAVTPSGLAYWAARDNVTFGTQGQANKISLATTHPTVNWELYNYSAEFEGVRDDIVNIGFNDYNHTDLTKAGMAFQMENDYSSGGIRVSEFIWSWQSPAGTSVRPYQINMAYADNAAQHLVVGEVRYYSNGGGNPHTIFYSGGQIYLQDSYLLAQYSERPFRQQNSLSAEVDLIYLDTIGGVINSIGIGEGQYVFIDAYTHLSNDADSVLLAMGTDTSTNTWLWYIDGLNRLNLYTGSVWGFQITTDGRIGINTSGITDGISLDVNGDQLRLRTSKTPASAGAAGNAGAVCWDANYIYVCTATNTWKRAAISTWP